ncbi:hypothetical protein OG883_39160 [Streptomyces sp. NBC_01142]|uniref:hypothetical protein n=1 Tax=Streptomyces sp. NBC_01142 TaxID=2975865 RepID=UPI00224EE0DC|nr:hypothetical protein [Streptomyces sp. NBC_01142]MCX4825758.1 hypothetical protein [Streptomyces sp. NBC_01142]
MATDGVGQQPVDALCPGCGGAEVHSVEEARSDKRASGKNLHSRLEKGPDKNGDGCLHFVEGMVLVGLGVGLAYTGVEREEPLYTLGGVVLAVLMLIGTIAVVRSDGQEKAAAEAGEARADRLWRTALYCYGCESVFCLGGSPWRGALTPEQFKKLVWTESGYGDQLVAGDKAKDAEVPPGIVPPGR